MSVNSKMTALADTVRAKTGLTDALSIDDMISGIEGMESDAVPTDCIIFKSRNAQGYATEVDYYKSDGYIPPAQFGGLDSSVLPFRYVHTFNFKDEITRIGAYGISYNIAITSLNFPSVTEVGGYAFRANTALLSAYLPKVTRLHNDDLTAIFRQCSSLQSFQLGSIGNGVTLLNRNICYGCNNIGLCVTVYCTGSSADSMLNAVRNYGTNATIIIKASEDTSYDGAYYTAGDTIITSTP